MKKPAKARRNAARKNECITPFALAPLVSKDLLPGPENIDTIRRIEGLARQRNLKSLCELGQISDIEYPSSDTVWTILAQRQVSALFKKNESLVSQAACIEAAGNSFLRAEMLCRLTNKRLQWFNDHEDRLDPLILNYVQRMRFFIKDLLGDKQAYIDTLPEAIRLTNGATEDRSRRRSLPFLKVSGKIRCPWRAFPFADSLLRFYGVDPSNYQLTNVYWNTVTLVPKNWKTHRTIAKEPTHSLPFQLSLDRFLKRKLRGWGIDLSNQGKNQEMAKRGSIDGTIATLDLEMASDTLSFNTVAYLLPSDWFDIFNSFRSPCYKGPFGEGEYAKFSSMGNGYTFTLETLIFAAACRAVRATSFSVYGDDIACNAEAVKELVRLLNFLGFKVNKEKSYVNPDSRFRESCGCDYYKGHFVTPVYMRENPDVSDSSSVSHLLNSLISVTPPGVTWDFAVKTVKSLKLRVVPYQDDSRAGVWITPNLAWKTKRLFVDRRHSRRGSNNPHLGFPVFHGYGLSSAIRSTAGWRSLLLWHVLKHGHSVEDASDRPVRRVGEILLKHGNDMDCGDCLITSQLTIRSRYVHKTRRYSPTYSTPSYLFLWDEVVEDCGCIPLKTTEYTRRNPV